MLWEKKKAWFPAGFASSTDSAQSQQQKHERAGPQLLAEFGHYYKCRAGGGEMPCQLWTQEEVEWSLKDKIRRSVLTLSAFADGKIRKNR